MAAPERYWVVQNTIAGRGGVPQYQVVASVSRPRSDVSTVVAGPFATRAQAEADLRRRANPPLPVPDLPNPFAPLSAIGKIGHWIGDIVLHVTDVAMWRSLGWLSLGALLVIAGIYLWFRTSGTYQSLQSSVTGAVQAL